MTKLLQLLEDDCTLTPDQLASMADMPWRSKGGHPEVRGRGRSSWAIRPLWTGTAPSGRRSPPSSR